MVLKENHDEKKSRKKWNRRKHMCFTVQDAKVSILAESVAKNWEATKSQQQKSQPGGTVFYRGKMSGSLLKWRQLHKTRGSRGSGCPAMIIIKKQQHSTTITAYFHAVVRKDRREDFLKCSSPLGGMVLSPTKCLLYPFPVSRPITWRYYLREFSLWWYYHNS